MELTCLMCFWLIVLAGFVGGGIIHAKVTGGEVRRLSGAVVKAAGWHAAALLWVIVAVGWTEDVVEAVRLLG